VKESWNAELHPTGIDLIVQNASKYAETVVVTGGEPLMWDMSLLTNKLKDVGRKAYRNLRAYPLSGTWDWICLFAEKKTPTETVYNAAHELKVIIHNKHDFVFAEEQAELVNEAILFYNLSGAKKRK
jgi:organic radical activating enzyme